MIKKVIFKLFKSQFFSKFVWLKEVLQSLNKNSRTKSIEYVTKYEQVIEKHQTVVMKTIWQHDYALISCNRQSHWEDSWLYLIQARKVLLIILFRIKFTKLNFEGSLIVLELEPRRMSIWLQWVVKK